MVLKTLEYYTQLSSTISAVAPKKWEQEIVSAEHRRLEVPRDEFGEAIPSGPDEASEIEHVAVPPKLRALHLPSSHKKNDHHPLCQAELTLRIKQATQYLAAMREAVAEKSFQYLHIMCSAPSKALRT